MKSVQVSAALTITGILILGISVGYAQSNLASVSGVVSDPQGAVVPAAAVSATNTATGVDTKTATDSSGFYAIRNLPIGAYTLMIEHPGFRRYVRQGIILTTVQSLGLDVRLELREFSQTVNVTGEASLLETRTSDVSNVVTSKSVEALPPANRLLLNLVQLSGAAVFVDSVTLNTAPDFSLAGGRTGTPMAWLDGADIQNLRLGVGLITIDPPVDAIQEVKVLENNYSAEYGGSSGGVFPRFAPSGFSALGSAQQERRQDPIKTVTVLDNLSWVLGRHALRFGFQETRSINNDVLLSAVSGSFSFSTLPTGLPGNSASGSGLASLLLGFPTSFSELATEELDRRSWYLAGFAGDDWTVNSKLTLNLGLRWETDTPMLDVHNRINGFDLSEINPVSGTSGVVKFAGVNGFPTSVYSGDWNNFGPRFGFAWVPPHSDNTVVCGGYGVFYSHPFDQGNPIAAALGFSLSANLTSPDNGITAPFFLRDGVPVSSAAPALNDAFGAAPVGENPNTAVTFFERQRKTGTSQQFNLAIEQRLRGGFVVQIAGLGNISRNLPGDNLSLNQIPASILGPGHDSQNDRPFPQFSDVSVISPSTALSNYYAGMLHLEKRFSQGFSVGASYTYSSFLVNCDHNGAATLGDNGGCYSNAYDRAADYGPAANDIRHDLVFNWVYELPFGSGRRWPISAPLRFVASGWTLANVTTIHSGPPFTVTALTNTTDAFSAGALRPNVLRNPDLSSSQRSVSRWFDIEAFQQPVLFQFGNEGVGALRAAGLVNFDFYIIRNLRLNERARLEIRGEFFNAFNHTNLGLPGHIFGASDFGVISSSGSARVVQLGARTVF